MILWFDIRIHFLYNKLIPIVIHQFQQDSQFLRCKETSPILITSIEQCTGRGTDSSLIIRKILIQIICINNGNFRIRNRTSHFRIGNLSLFYFHLFRSLIQRRFPGNTIRPIGTDSHRILTYRKY